MNRTTALLVAAVCFLSAGPATHADQISYSFQPTGPQFYTNSGTLGAIRLMNTAGNFSGSTSPSTITTDVRSFSFGLQMHDSMSVNLQLSDGKGDTANVNVGSLSGNLYRQWSTLQFQSNGDHTVNLGGTLYTVHFAGQSQLGLFGPSSLSFTVTDPPGPGSNNGGGTVAGSGGGTTTGTPEPTSLALAAIGLPLVGLTLRRRLRPAVA